jgi:outer membrane lipoprotein-sorting protein
VLASLSALPAFAGAPSPSQTESAARAPAAPTNAPGRGVLDQFAAAWADVKSYTATVTVTERSGAQTQNVVFDYTFHKPSSVTVHVNGGPNAGVTMIWDGGTTLVAHRGSGFAALFKKTFALHDPQTTTIRGSSIDQLSFGAILEHAQQQAGTVTQAPQSQLDGVDVDALTLMSTDSVATNAGLTREVVDLSASTHLPVQVLGYDGSTLVRQIDFSNVTLVR